MKNKYNRMCLRMFILTVLAGTCLLTCLPSQAGKGGWNLPNKVVDLHLYLTQTNPVESLQYSTSDAGKLSYWLNEASKKMWNATEGNLRVGTVYVYNKSRNGLSSADIQFLEGPDSANAHINGLGKSGTRMAFWMPRVNNTFQVPQRFLQNALVHEFGHYGFGIYDEYLGHIRATKPKVVGGVVDQTFYANPRPGSAGADYWGWNGGGDAWMTAGRVFFSAWSLNTTGMGDSKWTSSLMDLDFASHCTEFSWDGDYPYSQMTTDSSSGVKLPGHLMTLSKITTKDGKTTLLKAGNWWVSTEQEERLRESCWSTVARKLGIANLTSAPSTAMPSGFVDIKWVLMNDRRSIELCIDRSGSMGGYPMEQAKEGAKLFANLAKVATAETSGDFLGVVDFDDYITVTAAIRELSSSSTRNQILSAIDGLYARGMTSIGGGLQKSRLQLESLGTTGAGEIIVLLSDGEENTSPWVSSVLPAVVSRGIKVYSISLGSGANLNKMQSIADQTHGKHYIISDPADLQAAYADINQLSQEAVPAASAYGMITPGAESRQDVTVNPGAAEVTFVLTADSPQMTLRLRSPSGVMMTEASHDPNVEFISSGSSRIARVTNPQPGVWVPIIALSAAPNAITSGKQEVPPVAIPDGTSKLTRTLSITNNEIVTSIYPSISILHGYPMDLKITLKSPKGTAVVLHNHNYLDRELVGTYGVDLMPSQSLSAFTGESMKGSWQLTIEDTSLGDAGTFSSWALTFNSAAPSASASFTLLSTVQDDKIQFSASVESANTQYPEPVVMHAAVDAGGPVKGAVVTALVTHPDGETQSLIPLYDDGNGGNADVQQGDGIYSAKFSGFSQDGTYTSKVVVNSTNAYVVFSGNAMSTNVPAPVPAPKFVREQKVSFAVSDVPDPRYNAVQVKSLAITKGSNNLGGITASGLFNADSWQYNPKDDDIHFSIDGYQLYLAASDLVQKGRNFTYSYTSDDRKLKRTITISPYVGGTSKCSYSIAVNGDNLAGISYSSAVPEINFGFGAGSLSDSASLLVNTTIKPTGSTATYKALSSGELSPALYVQSASVRRSTRSLGQDTLQLLVGTPGWSMPAELSQFAVQIEFGGQTYSFAAGSLVKQKDRTFKASLNSGKLALHIKPEKRLLQLTGKNQSLAGFSNPAIIRITIAGQTQVARITMGYNTRSTTYTY